MDDRGYWHDQRHTQQVERVLGVRPVIEIDAGEGVMIVKGDGQVQHATFDSAEKNKVTLTPTGDQRPYLELAERVALTRANQDSVVAQVWDNRGGKIILRTLPVGGLNHVL